MHALIVSHQYVFLCGLVFSNNKIFIANKFSYFFFEFFCCLCFVPKTLWASLTSVEKLSRRYLVFISTNNMFYVKFLKRTRIARNILILFTNYIVYFSNKRTLVLSNLFTYVRSKTILAPTAILKITPRFIKYVSTLTPKA